MLCLYVKASPQRQNDFMKDSYVWCNLRQIIEFSMNSLGHFPSRRSSDLGSQKLPKVNCLIKYTLAFIVHTFILTVWSWNFDIAKLLIKDWKRLKHRIKNKTKRKKLCIKYTSCGLNFIVKKLTLWQVLKNLTELAVCTIVICCSNIQDLEVLMTFSNVLTSYQRRLTKNDARRKQ